MEPTRRARLPYADADVAEPLTHVREICAALPEVTVGLRLDRNPDWPEVAAVVRAAYVQVAPKTLARRLESP